MDWFGNIIHCCLQLEAMYQEHCPAGFPFHSSDFHVMAKCLSEAREVWFILCAPYCQWSTKDQVVSLREVSSGKVTSLELGMLSENVVADSQTFSGGDGEFTLQLNNNLLFCCWELLGEKLRLGFLTLHSDSGKSGVWCIGGCNYCSGEWSHWHIGVRSWEEGTLELGNRLLERTESGAGRGR